MSEKNPPWRDHYESPNIVIHPTVSLPGGPSSLYKVPRVEGTKAIKTIEEPVEIFKIPCIIRSQRKNVCESVVNQYTRPYVPEANVNWCEDYVQPVQHTDQYQYNNFSWENNYMHSNYMPETNYCPWYPQNPQNPFTEQSLGPRFISTVYNQVKSIDSAPVHLIQTQEPKSILLNEIPNNTYIMDKTPTGNVINPLNNDVTESVDEKSFITNEITKNKEATMPKDSTKEIAPENKTKAKPLDKKRKRDENLSESSEDGMNQMSTSKIEPKKIKCHNNVKQVKHTKNEKQDRIKKTLDKRENFKSVSLNKYSYTERIKKLSRELQKVDNEILKRKKELKIKEILIQREQQAIELAEQNEQKSVDKSQEDNKIVKLKSLKSENNKLIPVKKTNLNYKKQAKTNEELITKIRDIKAKYDALKKASKISEDYGFQKNKIVMNIKSVIKVPKQFALNDSHSKNNQYNHHENSHKNFAENFKITRTNQQSKEETNESRKENPKQKCNIKYRHNGNESNRENLVIMVNNKNTAIQEQVSERKVKLQKKRKMQDYENEIVNCKKIKKIEFIINLVTEGLEQSTENESGEENTTFEKDSSAVDLSFLDDIDVDEIAKCLNDTEPVNKTKNHKTNISKDINDFAKLSGSKEVHSQCIDQNELSIGSGYNASEDLEILLSTNHVKSMNTETLQVCDDNEKTFDIEWEMEQMFKDDDETDISTVKSNLENTEIKETKDECVNSLVQDPQPKQTFTNIVNTELEAIDKSVDINTGEYSNEVNNLNINKDEDNISSPDKSTSGKGEYENDLHTHLDIYGETYEEWQKRSLEKMYEEEKQEASSIEVTRKKVVTIENNVETPQAHASFEDLEIKSPASAKISDDDIINPIDDDIYNGYLKQSFEEMYETEKQVACGMYYSQENNCYSGDEINEKEKDDVSDNISKIDEVMENIDFSIIEHNIIEGNEVAKCAHNISEDVSNDSAKTIDLNDVHLNYLIYDTEIVTPIIDLTEISVRDEDDSDVKIIEPVVDTVDLTKEEILFIDISSEDASSSSSSDSEEDSNNENCKLDKKTLEKTVVYADIDCPSITNAGENEGDNLEIPTVMISADIQTELHTEQHLLAAEKLHPDGPIEKNNVQTNSAPETFEKSFTPQNNTDGTLKDYDRDPQNNKDGTMKENDKNTQNNKDETVKENDKDTQNNKDETMKENDKDTQNNKDETMKENDKNTQNNKDETMKENDKNTQNNKDETVKEDDKDTQNNKDETMKENDKDTQNNKDETMKENDKNTQNNKDGIVKEDDKNGIMKEDDGFTQNNKYGTMKEEDREIQKADPLNDASHENGSENPCPEKFQSLVPTNLINKTVVQKLTARILEFTHTEYTVASIIHNGTFSQIYKCEDRAGNVVAAKISKVDDASTGNERELMLLQVQNGIPKEKYSCVHLINGLAIDTNWCYLLEYYPKNLQQCLNERETPFHIETVMALAKQLVSAVVILRNNNIVHSDIKPSHILLDEHNEQLKLGGFDTSYYIEDSRLTGVVGATSYRAPEAILGYSEGPSIDVWATALVLYEMATKRNLFPGTTNNEVLYQQMSVLGKLPGSMALKSEFWTNYFRGNCFIRQEPMEVISWFTKTPKVRDSVIQAYYHYWFHSRSKNQRSRDFGQLNRFSKLLNEMLVLDPANRLPIEFVYANPLIYS